MSNGVDRAETTNRGDDGVGAVSAPAMTTIMMVILEFPVQGATIKDSCLTIRRPLLEGDSHVGAVWNENVLETRATTTIAPKNTDSQWQEPITISFLRRFLLGANIHNFEIFCN